LSYGDFRGLFSVLTPFLLYSLLDSTNLTSLSATFHEFHLSGIWHILLPYNF